MIPGPPISLTQLFDAVDRSQIAASWHCRLMVADSFSPRSSDLPTPKILCLAPIPWFSIMTRITNFGIKKRTYVEAGFSKEPEPEITTPVLDPSTSVDAITAPAADAVDQPPKKKRKRNKKPKTGVNVSDLKEKEGDVEGGDDQVEGEGKDAEQAKMKQKKAKSKAGKKSGNLKDSKTKGAF